MTTLVENNMSSGEGAQPVFRVVEAPAPQNQLEQTRIAVLGIGGAGCNIVRYFSQQPLPGVSLISINTDAQSLAQTSNGTQLLLGEGRSTGADPKKGRQLLSEASESIAELLTNTDMVFMFAGMGRGTGTGGMPVVANIAKQSGALTVAAVIRPFAHENCDQIADDGIKELHNSVDSVMEFSNERLIELHAQKSLEDAFTELNKVLYSAVHGIREIATVTGIINIDFSNVRAVMENAGRTFIGTGSGSGDDAPQLAVQQAIDSPLMHVALEKQARGILCNVTAPSGISVDAMQAMGDILNKFSAPDCKLIRGLVLDPNMKDEVRVTLVATMSSKADPVISHNTKLTDTSVARSQNEEAHRPHKPVSETTIDYDTPSFNRYPSNH